MGRFLVIISVAACFLVTGPLEVRGESPFDEGITVTPSDQTQGNVDPSLDEPAQSVVSKGVPEANALTLRSGYIKAYQDYVSAVGAGDPDNIAKALEAVNSLKRAYDACSQTCASPEASDYTKAYQDYISAVRAGDKTNIAKALVAMERSKRAYNSRSQASVSNGLPDYTKAYQDYVSAVRAGDQTNIAKALEAMERYRNVYNDYMNRTHGGASGTEAGIGSISVTGNDLGSATGKMTGVEVGF